MLFRSELSLADQRIVVRTEIWNRVQEIIELIPASPEYTVGLTCDVLRTILQGVCQAVDATSPTVARLETRQRECINSCC
jgi:hypothetical protein